MSLAESIEAALAYHLYTSGYLFVAEGVAGAKQMFIFARAVNEDWLTVEAEAVVGPLGCEVRGER